MVRRELGQSNNNMDPNVLHPRVDQILPMSNNHLTTPETTPRLLQEIERYEEEHIEDTHEEMLENNNHGLPQIVRGGIDMSRYSEFTDSNGQIQYDNLYSTLSYAILQGRNLDMVSDHQEDLLRAQQLHLQNLQGVQAQVESTLERKRERVDEVNEQRKRRQLVDFKPVNDYLQERWKDGIRSVIDLGIEAGKLDKL